MKISSEIIEGCAVFTISGSVELFAADEIGKTLSLAIKRHSYDKLILDFGGVDYIDSTGIGALLKTAADCRGKVEIRICSPQPSIVKLFGVINLNKLIPVDGTLEESLSVLNRQNL